MSKHVKLDSYQRAWLRKEAHSLQPVLHIGLAGLSPAIEKAFREALESHELVKVRFVQGKEEKQDMSRHLADEVEAELVSVIGNTAIFWKPAKEAENRHYTLPEREKPRASGRPSSGHSRER